MAPLNDDLCTVVVMTHNPKPGAAHAVRSARCGADNPEGQPAKAVQRGNR